MSAVSADLTCATWLTVKFAMQIGSTWPRTTRRTGAFIAVTASPLSALPPRSPCHQASVGPHLVDLLLLGLPPHLSKWGKCCRAASMCCCLVSSRRNYVAGCCWLLRRDHQSNQSSVSAWEVCRRASYIDAALSLRCVRSVTGRHNEIWMLPAQDAAAALSEA